MTLNLLNYVFLHCFGVMVHDFVEHVARYKCSFMLLGLKKADTSYAFICVSNGVSASDFINYLNLVSTFFLLRIYRFIVIYDFKSCW